ncbi:hypothetical protein GCM10009846_20880 [Agrococcus versicolor]|uniref:DUF559 domain-containing protein n=1 Tax=Agrococcus versicolor TaxID=501482 RepID=A0ABN3ATY8_9MICO
MSHLLPPAPEVRAFAVADALAEGRTRRQLAGDAYLAPLVGTRVPRAGGETVTRAQFLDAVRSVARDDQFLSHITAALAHGMPIPLALQRGPVHLASPTIGHRMRRPGVVGHRLKAEVVEVDGIRVEHPHDAFVHLATLLPLHPLVAVADWLLQARNPCSTSKQALVERLDGFRGARGLPLLRMAIAMARVGVESPRETELRLLVMAAGHPEPVCNVDVRDSVGRFLARVDLAWPSLRVALEYDGEQHRLDDRQFARDIERGEALERAGWIVVRVTKEHMADPRARVLPRLAAAFARRRAA